MAPEAEMMEGVGEAEVPRPATLGGVQNGVLEEFAVEGSYIGILIES